MRKLKPILFISVIALVLQLFLPWWSVGIAAFIGGLAWDKKVAGAFLSGFLGIFLLWVIYALIIDIRTSSILSPKIAQLFSLPALSLITILLTGIVGGLVGGFSALTGNFVRKTF